MPTSPLPSASSACSVPIPDTGAEAFEFHLRAFAIHSKIGSLRAGFNLMHLAKLRTAVGEAAFTSIVRQFLDDESYANLVDLLDQITVDDGRPDTRQTAAWRADQANADTRAIRAHAAASS